MTKHTDTPRPEHPVEALLRTILDDLAGLADAPASTMDAVTTTRVVILAAHARARVAEIQARLLGETRSWTRPVAE